MKINKRLALIHSENFCLFSSASILNCCLKELPLGGHRAFYFTFSNKNVEIYLWCGRKKPIRPWK